MYLSNLRPSYVAWSLVLFDLRHQQTHALEHFLVLQTQQVFVLQTQLHLLVLQCHNVNSPDSVAQKHPSALDNSLGHWNVQIIVFSLKGNGVGKSTR